MPSVARHAAADLHVRRARRAARRRDARPAGRAARALGGGARDFRRVGAAPEPDPPGRSVVAGRAASAITRRSRSPSPSSIRTIRSRSPTSSSSARSRSSASSRIAFGAIVLVGIVVAVVPLASSRWTRARSASSSPLAVGDGAPLPRAEAHHRLVRRRHRPAPAGLPLAPHDHRAPRPDLRRRAGAARRGLPPAGAGAEFARRHMAGVRARRARRPRRRSDRRHRRESRGVWPTRTAGAGSVAAVVLVPVSEPPRFALDDRGAHRRAAPAVRRCAHARVDRARRRPADRRHPHHARAVRARDPRPGDAEAGDGSRAAGAPGADQPALPLQRAHDHRLPDPGRAVAGARHAAAAHVAPARRAALGGRIDDARTRARRDRGVPRHRARALRGSAPGRNRRAAGAARHPRPARCCSSRSSRTPSSTASRRARAADG